MGCVSCGGGTCRALRWKGRGGDTTTIDSPFPAPLNLLLSYAYTISSLPSSFLCSPFLLPRNLLFVFLLVFSSLSFFFLFFARSYSRLLILLFILSLATSLSSFLCSFAPSFLLLIRFSCHIRYLFLSFSFPPLFFFTISFYFSFPFVSASCRPVSLLTFLLLT